MDVAIRPTLGERMARMTECICGHTENKHEYRSHMGGCLISTCFCTTFEEVEWDDDRWLPGDDQ
jgi:hypothetical protein